AGPGAMPRSRRVPRRTGPLVQMERADVWIDGKQVLHGIDFAVQCAQCWVVHGANGSGNSTLLRTLHVDHPVALGGSIARAGIEPGVPLDDFRAHTGLIAQHLQTDSPRQLTVLDTVVSGPHASIGL